MHYIYHLFTVVIIVKDDTDTVTRVFRLVV